MPQESMMTADAPKSCSWIFKGILNCRPLTQQNQVWNAMLHLPKFETGLIYRGLQGDVNLVPWRSIFYKNVARPRSQMVLWTSCNERLATRERLNRFGLLATAGCCFCPQVETQNHLFFDCHITCAIWKELINWLKVQHTPRDWSAEILWILRQTRGKGWRAKLLKLAFTKPCMKPGFLETNIVLREILEFQEIIE